RDSGECERAIDRARQVLAVDGANEPAHRDLMFCYAALGKRADALRQYEELVRLLRSELDVEPSAETRALYEQIKHPTPPSIRPASPPARVPRPLTSFIGRTSELEQVQGLLRQKHLLTLAGAGGSGKTRLAIQVASHIADIFQDGVCWVELAGLANPALVPQAVASALGVRELSNHPLTETLADLLCSRQMLLLLDNCEHLISACAALAAALLQACPDLTILATSREPLGIAGETVLVVPPLAFPPALTPEELSPQSLMQYEAVRLFVDRAAAARPGFQLTAENAPAVAQITRRLDGIPLAIELAAARVRLLKVETIAARLDDRFNLLTGGEPTALPRHRTLRATIDWSYDLLPDPARVLLRRLSVFAGGFTLDAAEQVCSDEALPLAAVLDNLARLVDRSLVALDEGHAVERYRLLETVREYAREKLLGAGEAGALCDRHLAFFLRLGEQVQPQLQVEEVGWFQRLDLEIENIRAALEWSMQESGADGEAARFNRLQSGMRLAWSLTWFLENRYRREALGLLKQMLARTSDTDVTPDRAMALAAAGILEWTLGDLPQARVSLEAALQVARKACDRLSTAWVLIHLGAVADFQGDYSRAESLEDEALAVVRELGPIGKNISGLGVAILGDVRFQLGEQAGAEALYAESMEMLKATQNKKWMAYVQRRMGYLALQHDRAGQAGPYFAESLRLNLQTGHQLGILASIAGLAALLLVRGERAGAAELFRAVEHLLDVTKSSLFAVDQIEWEHYRGRLVAGLDAGATQALARGHTLSLEQAVELALRATETSAQASG
ncbi:MAG: ATP-binding protein, partial [Rudaea sp.]